jgi:hypothetical protein
MRALSRCVEVSFARVEAGDGAKTAFEGTQQANTWRCEARKCDHQR